MPTSGVANDKLTDKHSFVLLIIYKSFNSPVAPCAKDSPLLLYTRLKHMHVQYAGSLMVRVWWVDRRKDGRTTTHLQALTTMLICNTYSSQCLF